MSDLKSQYLIRRQQVLGTTETTNVQRKSNQNQVAPQTPFKDILNQVSSEQSIKFSKHALNRLEERDIQLSTDEIAKISNAVKQAEGKGIRDALILMGDKAFIANVKSRTIVTAAAEQNLKDNVFTNIDGAVIIQAGPYGGLDF